MKSKRGMELRLLGWTLLGLAVIVIGFFAVKFLQGSGSEYIDWIANKLRFR